MKRHIKLAQLLWAVMEQKVDRGGAEGGLGQMGREWGGLKFLWTEVVGPGWMLGRPKAA